MWRFTPQAFCTFVSDDTAIPIKRATWDYKSSRASIGIEESRKVIQ